MQTNVDRRRFLLASAAATSTQLLSAAPATTSTLSTFLIHHDVAVHLDVLKAASDATANARVLGHLLPGQQGLAAVFVNSEFADLRALGDLEASLAKGVMPALPKQLNDLYSRTLTGHVTLLQGGLSLPIGASVKTIQHDHIFDPLPPAVYFTGGMLTHEPATVIASAELAKMTVTQLANRGLLTASTVATKISANQIQLILGGTAFNNQSMALNATLQSSGLVELDLVSAAAPRFGSKSYRDEVAAFEYMAAGGDRTGLFSWFKKVVSKVVHFAQLVKSTISRWVSVIPKPILHWITDRISTYLKGKLLQLLPQAAVFA